MFTRTLPGQRIDQGLVIDWTTTAYKVETPEGETIFVPFEKQAPVQPLVIFG